MDRSSRQHESRQPDAHHPDDPALRRPAPALPTPGDSAASLDSDTGWLAAALRWAPLAMIVLRLTRERHVAPIALNAAAEAALGGSPSGDQQLPDEWLSDDDRSTLATACENLVEPGETAELSLMLPRADGTSLPGRWRLARLDREGRFTLSLLRTDTDTGTDGDPPRFATPASDERDDPTASSDALTGLPDRRALLARLGPMIDHDPGGAAALTAVLLLDIDRFKQVNDRHGHLVGDDVLQQLVARLTGAVRPGDFVARYGGDEFVIVTDSLHASGDAARIAERLIRVMAEPLDVRGEPTRFGASVGIVADVAGCSDVREVIHRADQAMYRAKSAGGSRYVVSGI